MGLPFSKSQIERLGGRLVATKPPADADLALLHELLDAYGDVLSESVERVRSALDADPTARVKNTGTIIEKLERHGGSWLKSIHDLAGMRIVGDVDRRGQDQLVARLVELFGDEARPPRTIDRRVQPSHGYRAVHVVVFPEGCPVEIQVRTVLQHGWAELFEKLADRLGRGIRYGEPPAEWPVASFEAPLSDLLAGQNRLGRELLAGLLSSSDLVDQVEQIRESDPRRAWGLVELLKSSLGVTSEAIDLFLEAERTFGLGFQRPRP